MFIKEKENVLIILTNIFKIQRYLSRSIFQAKGNNNNVSFSIEYGFSVFEVLCGILSGRKIMHQSFVTTAPRTYPHIRGWAEDSRANVRGSDLFSSPAVPGKCRACNIMQIYPSGIFYYKEPGYESQQGLLAGL